MNSLFRLLAPHKSAYRKRLRSPPVDEMSKDLPMISSFRVLNQKSLRPVKLHSIRPYSSPDAKHRYMACEGRKLIEHWDELAGCIPADRCRDVLDGGSHIVFGVGLLLIHVI